MMLQTIIFSIICMISGPSMNLKTIKFIVNDNIKTKRYCMYRRKYNKGDFLNPYSKIAYGSYQVLVNILERVVANKIPNNPQ